MTHVRYTKNYNRYLIVHTANMKHVKHCVYQTINYYYYNYKLNYFPHLS